MWSKNISWTCITSRGTLLEKHNDAFARIRGFLFLRQGWSFGSSKVGETYLVIDVKAFSAASQTNLLSWEDLRRSWVSWWEHSVWNVVRTSKVQSNEHSERVRDKIKDVPENPTDLLYGCYTRWRCLQMSCMRFYTPRFLDFSVISRRVGSPFRC